MKKLSIPLTSKALFAYEYFEKNNNTNVLVVCHDEISAIIAHKQIFFFADKNNKHILLFPSLDTVPYDKLSPNTEILSKRASILTQLAFWESKIYSCNFSPKFDVKNTHKRGFF